MFDKLKQLGDLKKMKEEMDKQRKTIEKDGVVVTVNGRMEMEDLKLNPQMDITSQELIVKECFNQAVREIQKEVAQKMFNMKNN
ncbi:MAG: YbaB/EbfC family nucleoid-associated protein [Candidatus Nealsonbacteria bacterium]